MEVLQMIQISNSVSEGGIIGAWIFNPSSVPGSQWRPPSGNSFQNPTEIVSIYVFCRL